MRECLILLFLQLWGNVQVALTQNVTCSKVPFIPHAAVSEATRKTEYQGGDVIHLVCETGYTSSINIRYVCSGGDWVALYPGKCELKPCERPEDTPNGHYELIHGEDFVFGSTIKYFCNTGYQMISKEDTRTCLEKWTNHVPICDSLSCELPTEDESLIVTGIPSNGEPVRPHRFLTFECGPGKYMNGSSKLICGTDGQWDNPFPSCEDIACAVGQMHHHLDVYGLPPMNNKMKIGHKLQFQCSSHYVLEGPQEIKCLESGQWNAPFPTCSEHCRITGVPSSVRVIILPTTTTQLRSGQKIAFSCRREGQFMKGNEEVECLEGGQWSSPFPSCEAPSGCGRPTHLLNGDIITSLEDHYAHNTKIEYGCQNYYTMSGGPYRTCINGQWIGEMRCLQPCTVDLGRLERHNIVFKHKSDNKLYAPHDDHIEFMCKRGTTHDRVHNMRQRCDDGLMNLPTCY